MNQCAWHAQYIARPAQSQSQQTNQSHNTVPSEAAFLSTMKVSPRAGRTDGYGWVHADTGSGECKHLITDYLKCLRSRRGVNDDECRKLAKGYLGCRMDKYVSGPGVVVLVMMMVMGMARMGADCCCQTGRN